MTENNPESEIINHLLEVEKNASVLIDDALKEAENNKAKAVSEFNRVYKEKFDKLIAKKSMYYDNLISETKGENAFIKVSGDAAPLIFGENAELSAVGNDITSGLIDSLPVFILYFTVKPK